MPRRPGGPARLMFVTEPAACRQVRNKPLSERHASLLGTMKTTNIEIEQLAIQQHGVVSWRQLERRRISRWQIRWRVRLGQWVRELPGVWRMRWAEPTWMQRVWSAHLWAGPLATFSHRTAAALWQLDGVKLDRIEMSGPIQRHRVEWLLIHRTAPIPKQMQRIRNGLPLTSPARTLVDLAAVCGENELERAMEHAFRRRIASVDEVHHALRRMPTQGKAGTGRVLRLLEQGLFSTETHSELERQALRMFRRFGLPEPIFQYEVVADDLVLGFVDFAWPKAKVIVEAEGFQFHSGREVWESDINRYNAMAIRGWTVLRLTQADLRDPTNAFAKELGRAVRRSQKHPLRAAS